jgi:hypothetical protein
MEIGNNVIKCSNMSMYEKVYELTNMISASHDIVDSSIQSYPDAAVVAEMVMMGSLSKKCNHGTHSKKPTKTFERPDPHKTPSFIEEINMHSTTGMYATSGSYIRSNSVTSMIISDCVSVFEFMQRYEDNDFHEGRIILTDVLSLTHAATVAYVFEIISAIQGWDGCVTLNILATADMTTAMNVYVGVRTNVYVEECMSAGMRLNQLLSDDESEYTTVVTHDPDCERLIMNTNKRANVDSNLFVFLDTVSKEREIRSYAAEESMLVEMCPCSDPSVYAVRIVPTHESTDVLTGRLMYRNTSRSIFSRMNWYTSMIRSMSMGTMCYDCSVSLMLARSMMLALTGVTMDEKNGADADWRSHYHRELEPLRNVD